MTRLLIYLALLTGIVGVLSLRFFNTLPVNNEKFDFNKSALVYETKQKELAELLAPKVESEAPVEETVAAPEIVLETEEQKRGAELYAKCVVCHGKLGEGKKSQNAPKIGGQYPWYVYSQLVAFKSKKRINAVMDPYIKTLSDQDFKDLSEYVAKLPW